MNASKLAAMLKTAGISQVRNLTTDYLSVLGDTNLSTEHRDDLLNVVADMNLPESPAKTAWTIAREVDRYGESRDLVTMDGQTGDLIITAEKIEFCPLAGGINWGAAI